MTFCQKKHILDKIVIKKLIKFKVSEKTMLISNELKSNNFI